MSCPLRNIIVPPSSKRSPSRAIENRTLCRISSSVYSRKVPSSQERTAEAHSTALTNQLLRRTTLTTLVSFDFSHNCIDLRTLLARWQKKKAFRVSSRSIVKGFPSPDFGGVELPPPTVSPVLMHLCLPPTANISVQVLHDDLFD